jgi:hypothetical protein
MKNNIKRIIIFILSILLWVVLPFGAIAAGNINFLNISEGITGDQEVTISWTTDVPTFGKMIFGKSADNLVNTIEENKSAVKYHKIAIGNLASDDKYFYKIIGYNADSKSETFVQSFDTKKLVGSKVPPQISDFEIRYISATAVAITWKTDTLGSSYVEYGIGDLYNKKANNGKNVLEHLVILKSLNPGTTYNVRISSTDSNKHVSSLHYKNFTTYEKDQKDEKNLLVTYLRPNGPSDSQLTSKVMNVTFKTSNYANGTLTLKGQKSGSKTLRANLDYGTDHMSVFTDLDPDSCYTLNISMRDVFNNAFKNDYTVCTPFTSKYSDSSDCGQTNSTFYSYGNTKEVFETDDSIIVAGIDYERYPGIRSILKTSDSSKIWIISRNQRHQVVSSASLKDYGFSGGEVKTVSWPEIAKYPDAHLVKTPDSSAVYFLSQRADDTWVKISIPSPAVFNSYPSNKWGNIITISKTDLNSYQDVRFVKVQGNQAVYFINQGKKQSISDSVFVKNGFNKNEILIISQTHLNAYPSGGNYN